LSKINFEIKGIGKLIKENNLKVPIYQRPFAWKDKQVEELLNDIKESINANEDEYFLGTIVLSKSDEESRLEIVDGQQRISTIVIFFSAFLKYLEEEDSRKQIQSEYLSTYNIREKNFIPKLELSRQDIDYFRRLIIERDECEAKIESHQRIKNAYEIAFKKISNLLKANNDDQSILHDWRDFIDDKLMIVLITVSSDTNAFTIFETLNDRGLELAQIDLLKNYLYSKAGHRLDEAQNSWIELISKIETFLEDESLILTYIKHHWSSEHGFIRVKNKELYNNIKEKIRNPTQIITFINTLKYDIDLYIAILNHNNSFWNDYDNKCKEYIETLNYFGLEQYRPLLLTILKKFNKVEVKKSLKLILAWIIRNLITGSMGGGSLEQAYANTAKEIFEGTIKNTIGLKESLKGFIPKDEEFKERFALATVSKHKYARYYLKAIENYHRGQQNPELLVNTNPDSVDLEHILPEKPGKNWSNFTEDEVNTYVKRIGNLTLMKTKENNDFKSSSFYMKRKKYRESEIWLTNSLDKYKKWTRESIVERQKVLSEIAIKTWSLDL
jgi:uncharacterized protein with ParB-like and HNH nuclease domain